MADYIYTMESRLTPDQMRALITVQNIARSHGMNIYLTGGAIRDILTGFPIRDLDFTVQGNPLEFQRDLENAGGIVDMVDPALSAIHLILLGTEVEIAMARTEVFDKPGKPPLVTPATIYEDLRRRDFTFNAMALSLNEGSRGLLLDPSNGAADIEARLIRVLHSYSFLEDPSRLIRATRFATRFGYELEERTRARYESAREGEYIQYIGHRAIGYETEQIAHEENPIAVMKALEEQSWLKVLCAKWTVAKADVPDLAQLLKTRTTMVNFNINVDGAPAVMHFLTAKLGEAEITAIQRAIPHREFVAAWKRLENDAKELSKKLLSKEAAINSGAWKILSAAKPEALLYLDVTGHNKTADEKIKNFLGKWRQFQEKLPIAQMAELRITPQLPEYSRISQEAFLLLLDGKLRTDAEVMKFLAPFEPPPPPAPPTPVRRGRATVKKAAAPAVKAMAAAPAAEVVPAIAASSAAVSSKPVAAVKPSAQKHPVAEKSAPLASAAVAKNGPVHKTAVPAKAVAKPASKADLKPAAAKPGKAPAAKHPANAAKPASKPLIKPAAKAVKPVSKVVKSKAVNSKVAKPVAKAGSHAAKKVAVKKAPEKKKHGHKDDKKHPKRH
jgi:tRNA nucleotidyltransferase/poly(A) polymerase